MECVWTLHLISRMALKFTAGSVGKGSKWVQTVHGSMHRVFQALALHSLTEKPNDNEKGKYPAWRKATPTENCIDLPVETQMERGKCGPGCSNQPDKEYQFSVTWTSEHRVLQAFSLTFFMPCVFQVRSLRPIHWCIYLPSYIWNTQTLPIPFWNYLWYMSWRKSRFFYFCYNKISPLFFHRLILLPHPRFKPSSSVAEGRKIKYWQFIMASPQDDQFHLCPS